MVELQIEYKAKYLVIVADVLEAYVSFRDLALQGP
jgi:hypothetical protein